MAVRTLSDSMSLLFKRLLSYYLYCRARQSTCYPSWPWYAVCLLSITQCALYRLIDHSFDLQNLHGIYILRYYISISDTLNWTSSLSIISTFMPSDLVEQRSKAKKTSKTMFMMEKQIRDDWIGQYEILTSGKNNLRSARIASASPI